MEILKTQKTYSRPLEGKKTVDLDCVAAPLWISPGWYRLAVGCYIVIVIGWFAGVIAAFRSAIYAFAHRAETRIMEATNAIFHTDCEPQQVYVTCTAHKRRRRGKGSCPPPKFGRKNIFRANIV